MLYRAFSEAQRITVFEMLLDARYHRNGKGLWSFSSPGMVWVYASPANVDEYWFYAGSSAGHR
jgi:hypothetical protein